MRRILSKLAIYAPRISLYHRSLTPLYYLKDNVARTSGVHVGIPIGHYFVLVKTLMRMWLLCNNELYGAPGVVN